MSLGKNLLIGSIIAIPIAGYGAYKYVLSNYKVGIGNISIISQSGTQMVLQINLSVYSSIGVQFTLTDIYFDIYIQGYKVGNVSQSQTLVIPPHGSVSLPVTVTVDLTQISSNLVGILLSGVQASGYNITLVGYTHVKIGSLPFIANVALKEGFQLSV